MNIQVYSGADASNGKVENKGAYLHGELEDHVGYDIFYTDKELPKDGVYDLIVKTQSDVVINAKWFSWVANDEFRSQERGFMVDSLDKKAIEHAETCYKQRRIVI